MRKQSAGMADLGNIGTRYVPLPLDFLNRRALFPNNPPFLARTSNLDLHVRLDVVALQVKR